jgi:hypothetical protein
MDRRHALLALPVALAVCDSQDDARARLQMYDPAGALETSVLHAPRLERLDDAVICALSDHMWEANRILPELQRALAERHPNARFVSHADLPDAYGANPDTLVTAVQDAGCQAVLVASAG